MSVSTCVHEVPDHVAEVRKLLMDRKGPHGVTGVTGAGAGTPSECEVVADIRHGP